jgi:hypothetical protein
MRPSRADPCENRAVAAYFDLSAANARVAELRPLLTALRADRDSIARAQQRLERLRREGPDELEGKGGSAVQLEQQQLVATVRRMEAAVRQIDAWGVTLRDIGSGLVDFPALANGRPIWLCWRLGEDDIGWWHELETGIAGRKPLIDLE